MTTIQNTNAIINGSTTKLDPNKTYIMTKDGLVEDKTIDPMKEKWYRISEAAKEIRVSDQTVRNAIVFGNLLATEIPDSSAPGFHYMIKESDLIDWMDDKKKVRNQKKRDAYNARMREYQAKNYKSKAMPVTYEIPVDENGVKMLDASTVAERCGFKLTSIHNAISRHNLKATKHYVGGRSRWYISEADYKAWRETGSHDNHHGKKETPTVEKKEEISVKSSGRFVPNDLANLQLAIAELMVKAREEAYDEAYKKGFEDGKLSVEHDASDEYRKGYEQGKKEAKSELLAALKVM